MLIKEIPEEYNVTITINHASGKSRLYYTEVISNEQKGKVPSIRIPLLVGVDLVNLNAAIDVSYFDRKTYLTHVWRDVRAVKFNNFYSLQTPRQSKERTSLGLTNIGLNMPCTITGTHVSCEGCTLVSLSSNWFSIRLSDSELAIKDEITLGFTDDDVTYSFNGTIVRVTCTADSTMVYDGVVTDSVQNLNAYLSRKSSENFEQRLKEIRNKK